MASLYYFHIYYTDRHEVSHYPQIESTALLKNVLVLSHGKSAEEVLLCQDLRAPCALTYDVIKPQTSRCQQNCQRSMAMSNNSNTEQHIYICQKLYI